MVLFCFGFYFNNIYLIIRGKNRVKLEIFVVGYIMIGVFYGDWFFYIDVGVVRLRDGVFICVNV